MVYNNRAGCMSIFFFILFKQFGMKIINLNLQKELDSKIVYHENLVQILGFLLSSNDNNTVNLRLILLRLK